MEHPLLLTAAALAFIVGLAHSVAGEMFIFRNIVKDQLPPLRGSAEFTYRTLRAVWHVATAAFFGFIALLLHLALSIQQNSLAEFVQLVSAVSFLVCALIMAIGTKGKHPGWIAFFVIALCVWLG
ncbi:MAG: hypothetical protein L0Y80_11465 [Ignavibacteriae bacterium]|nr:hypothetical protein [Ignavibacteriota bacterium]